MDEIKKEVPFPYIPYGEYKSRIEKAKELMENQGIDGLLVFAPEDMLYYFGLGFVGQWERYPYFRGGIIPREGEPIFVGETLMIDTVDLESWVTNTKRFAGHPNPPTPQCPDPIPIFIDAVKEAGLANKTVGVEYKLYDLDGVSLKDFERIKEGLRDAKLVDATHMIMSQRAIKSKWEQNVMRQNAKATAKAYLKAIEFAEEGVTEREIYNIIIGSLLKEGVIESPWYNIVCTFASLGNFACFKFTDRKLKKGDIVLLDAGARYKGYIVDMQRTIHIGEPSPEIRHLAKASKIAYEAALEILGPGVPVGDLWKIPCEAIRKVDPKIARDWESEKYISWVGHSIGIRIHEPPILVKDGKEELKPGMIVTVEIPGMDIEKGIMGDMPEDMFLITENGYEWLTEPLGPPGLWIK
jgi:Xaa-Pro aminopeptidase